MKNMKKIAKAIGTLSLASLAVCASSLAMADESGWYVGANVGQSKAKIDNDKITSGLLGTGLATTSITNDDTDTGYKIFVGYKYNKNFAVEGGYYDLGQFGYLATTSPAGALAGNIKLRGVNLDAVGIWPMTEKFAAFGRVGANYAEAKDSFSGTGAVTVTNPNPSKRDTNYKLGLGLQYTFTDSLGIRAEAERYRINDGIGSTGDVDLVSVGLVYWFGQKKIVIVDIDTTPPFVTLAVPYNATVGTPVHRKARVAFSEPMDSATINSNTVILSQGKTQVSGAVLAPTGTTASFTQSSNLAPDTVYTGRVTTGVRDLAGNALENDYVWSFKTAPMPDLRVAGKTIIIDKFVMLEDTHFKYDKATLSKQGEDMLKQNIQIMKDNPGLKVRIAGYTSAAGTQEYNQALSERRADTVLSYMINEGGIAPERFDTIGYGETRPAVYESDPADVKSKEAKANMRVLFEVIVK